MNTPTKQADEAVSGQKWSVSTFMEFYDRVLGPKLFEPYGKLLVREIRRSFGREPLSRASSRSPAERGGSRRTSMKNWPGR